MKNTSKYTSNPLRYPVISLGAEYLTIGHLMRRNIFAYKAPPNNQGYDLICIHPDPDTDSKVIRVQVKSRYQTDCDRAFPVKDTTFKSFDYLIVVFLNIGYFYRRRPTHEGIREPEFYTLPVNFVKKHHKIVKSGWQKVSTKNLDIDCYKNENGFELIAKDLGIKYPSREKS